MDTFLLVPHVAPARTNNRQDVFATLTAAFEGDPAVRQFHRDTAAHGPARADRNGMPAYHEATSRTSSPLYRRFDFKVIGTVETKATPEILSMRPGAPLVT